MDPRPQPSLPAPGPDPLPALLDLAQDLIERTLGPDERCRSIVIECGTWPPKLRITTDFGARISVDTDPGAN